MAKDKSFYFTGPEDRLRLRARNLHTFVELADGVDDDTWLHHLRRCDCSAWIRESLGDAELAEEVAAVEREADGLEPRESRRRVADLISERYTLPHGTHRLRPRPPGPLTHRLRPTTFDRGGRVWCGVRRVRPEA